MTPGRRPPGWFLLLAVAGCGPAADPGPPDTGAREAARGFYRAVVQRDWARAYAALDPGSRKGCSEGEFVRRGEAYRRHLGFDPTEVRVPTCAERGDEATARVELTGPGAGRHHFKDAVTLRRHDGRWRVVLPPRFGK